MKVEIVRINPGQYIREVRREVSKVTWPSRKETIVTTTMVFVMAFVAAIFFFGVDMILSTLVRFVLGLGG